MAASLVLVDPEPAPVPVEVSVLALLRAGIPLTLLVDLAGCDPHSHELYVTELAG